MKSFLSLLFLFFNVLVLAQDFSPYVNVELLNLDCDSLNNLTISVSQDSNEVDIDTAYFSSNAGSFAISLININDTIGFANIQYANGINVNTNLIVDSIISNNLVNVISVEIITGVTVGSFNLENDSSSGIYIQIISPDDGNSYTYAGNSSVVTFQGLFLNPYPGLLTFNSTIVSELGHLDSQNFDFIISCQCITQFYSNVNVSCDNYLWDGILYDSTGLYTNIYTNVNGCDSVVTLDLTIHYSDSDTLSYVSCDNYLWDGILYDSTGLYTNIYTNVNGCDSVVTLVLQIDSCVFGCMDSLASNFNSNANRSDSTCEYLCYHPAPTGIYSDSITYNKVNIYWSNMTSLYCNIEKYHVRYKKIGDSIWNTRSVRDTTIYCPNSQFINSKTIYNLTSNSSYEYKVKAFYCDGYSSSYSSINFFTTASSGCLDSTASNYDSLVDFDDGSCEYLCYYPIPTGIYATNITNSKAEIYWDNMNSSFCIARNYLIRFREFGSFSWTTRSIISDSVCLGDSSVTFRLLSNLVDNTNYEYKLRARYCDDSLSLWSSIHTFTTGIGGCLDSLALNFDSLATDDNGSCIYPIGGCLDSTASNYDSLVDFDDGSCEYLCYYPIPTGIYATNITNSKAEIYWDNMNSSFCLVDRYIIRYKNISDSIWTIKAIADTSLNCLSHLTINYIVLRNLFPNSLYEYKIKVVYCDSSSSNFSSLKTFQTRDNCSGVSNLNLNLLSNSQTQLSWVSNGNYVFSNVKYRINGPGQSWMYFGGFGNKIFYPTSSVILDSLQHGQRYRAVIKLFCDSIFSSYSSSWSSPVSWRQNIAKHEAYTINDLEVYPNPSNDIFIISFSYS
ncbi:fibronectin type III domain-containing protein, partial [bacterium]|nr:fibronectin type III domain-containing protein [bacterium]